MTQQHIDIMVESDQENQTHSDDVDVSRLLSLLQSTKSARTRKRAAAELGNPSVVTDGNESKIVEKLTETVLSDDNPAVRSEAINSLYFHSNDYIDQLASTLIDRSTNATTTCIEWLSSEYAPIRMVGATGIQMGVSSQASLEINEALTDPDPRVQVRAVRAYADLDPSSVEPIRPLLSTYNSMVRHAAVRALIRIGTPEAFSMLGSVAHSNDEQLRRIAVEHLHELDRQKSARILLQALQDSSPTVRRTAMVSVIRLCTDGEAICGGYVRDILVTDDSFDRTAVIELLSDVLAETPDHATQAVRRHAVWLLGELTREVDDAEAIEWLLDPFTDSDWMLADIAAAYCSLLDRRIVEKELQSLLQEEVSTAVETRIERVLEKMRRTTVSAVESRSVEYTYVREPADYTEKHAN